MWIRMRFDIGWLDLLYGLAYCLLAGKRFKVVRQAEDAWSVRKDFLITLSVRSAFDLTLRALRLPPGSEVLLSALTVPDMVHIVRMHGLLPVPVDTDECGAISIASLRRAISPQSRMIVVAHLFGGVVPLDDVIELAREHQLLVVEDCAQSFRQVGDSGHPLSDVAMFSFGPIKTASALGGAVVRVSASELRDRMAELHRHDPIQTRLSFALRILRFTTLKAMTGSLAASMVRFCVERRGGDFDSFANSAARGFVSSNLQHQFRRQPSIPLLRLLRRRWRTYKVSRIERRVHLGRSLDARIGQRHAASHSYWVYPVFVRDPIVVRDRLRQAGFDATCRSRMLVVPSVDELRIPTSAHQIWKGVVFLPWYPEMSDAALDRMASLIPTNLEGL